MQGGCHGDTENSAGRRHGGEWAPLVLQLPDAQIGGGYEVVFDLCGLERSGQYVPGGTLAMDFTAEIYGGVSTVAKFKLTMNMKTGEWKVEPAN